MKRASYREAIFWIANNDDTDWLDDQSPMLSVTASLVMDLFAVSEERLIADIRREIKKARAGK